MRRKNNIVLVKINFPLRGVIRFYLMLTDQQTNGQCTHSTTRRERVRWGGGEEGNPGTSEHANPVLQREKKNSLLQ